MNERLVSIAAIKKHPDLPDRVTEDADADARDLASMAKHGQLQAIIIDTELRLIFGRRRVKLAKRLGWDTISARVVNLDDPLSAMVDENECRLELSPTDRTILAIAVERHETEKAKERQRQGGKKGGTKQGGLYDPQGCGKAPQASEPSKTREKAAAAAGMAPHTYEKAKAIVEQAQAGNPVAQKAQEEMDRTRKIAPAHAKLKAADGIVDDAGNPVPLNLKAAFEAGQIIKEAMKAAAKAARLWRELEATKIYIDFHDGDKKVYSTAFEAAVRKARMIRPALACGECGGQGCKTCGKLGYLAEGDAA